MTRLVWVAVLLTLSTGAYAQGVSCGKHDVIVAALAKQYQEERHVIAMAGGQGVVEFYVSPTATWTMLHTAPGGMTCIAAAGQNWQHRLPATKPKKSGTNT